MATIASHSLFTNVALTPDGDVWWEGMTETPPPHLTDWTGQAWTPGCGRKAAHPNARYTTPAHRCPVIDPAWEDPEGVPISAIVFGGRRMTTVPLVNEARSWEHGVFLGSTCSSETTAAATGTVGTVRHDPFAMLPFCGYHMGDYVQHWLDMGQRMAPALRPRIFYVNWFRKHEQGGWLWPGFGENVRVLKWISERLAGGADAIDTPIGLLPTAQALDCSGLALAPGALDQLLRVDVDGWRRESERIASFYARFGDRLPRGLAAQLDDLRHRLDHGRPATG